MNEVSHGDNITLLSLRIPNLKRRSIFREREKVSFFWSHFLICIRGVLYPRKPSSPPGRIKPPSEIASIFFLQTQQIPYTMTQLPDPTIDLDWSGYDGSIQSHFSKNAENHPDRTCVVETKSSEGPERRFTYKQIYEASNTLAHYLSDAGITNGDVVMIWAHRSVDLVISIMGTLV